MRLRSLTFATLLLVPSIAFSHSKAEQTTPANNAIVDMVELIEIRFDSPMRVTAISMTGPEGDVMISRETGLDPVTEFRASPVAPLGGGEYRIQWRGLAADGHPMQGSFNFTVAN